MAAKHNRMTILGGPDSQSASILKEIGVNLLIGRTKNTQFHIVIIFIMCAKIEKK